ncbi:DNA-processing protein DprA [Burkholderia sp. BCCIQ04A]|uniref:DNA-processing protein DprA n=1 Tax=Burkholderia anthinoferrum TaxID=3090833 RepID=A0ABU5WM50_9BURK|nr:MULTISPECIES: DNA-processing protein DprA [Burkholderia]MEB2503613.1 DNA-processing protein DprA [Burkholderia anthinoferrum]MEB2535137.1 DNA-processing protein DprA [Burkholderia anthinoferrum]MEB2560917.1 DNA-processing protein DprA [Burkholderia anthinoferrum]MEB2579463.1 DNA-processing protein DprA [Burkholderia anthinoferrum]KVN56110.1 DNA processing protein DprA [Burkholderia anthina]
MASRAALAAAFEGRLMSPQALTPAALRAWLQLAHAPGLPPAVLQILLAAFGSPAALLRASHEAIAAVASPAAAQAVRASERDDLDTRTDAALAWLDGPGNVLVTLSDPAYPPRLRDLHDPPPLLYVKGRLDLLHARGLAMVGSRHATPQGLADATLFARGLSDAGLTIVSGLALGIDSAAHRGGLDGRSGTVAVIATGADLVYPARHRALAHEIATHGAIVSEWPLGTPARAAHFPQRNRLIAALALGVLVVEAAPRSGSLITARLANELGRDVFAMPGSIHAPLAQGCHALIRDGAKLTAAPFDVLEEYGLGEPAAQAPAGTVRAADPGPNAGESGEPETAGGAPANRAVAAAASPRIEAASPVTPSEQAVLAALGYGPVTYEWLAEHSGLSDDVLHGALLALELAGRVASVAGGRFARLDAAPTPSARGVLHSPP